MQGVHKVNVMARLTDMNVLGKHALNNVQKISFIRFSAIYDMKCNFHCPSRHVCGLGLYTYLFGVQIRQCKTTAG